MAVLTLVDAENIDFWLKDVKDSSRQISFADMVLINKIDLVSVEKLQEINLTIGKINPTAEIHAAVQGDFDVSSFIEQKAFSAEMFSERLEVLPAYESVGIHGIKTFTLFFDGFLDLRSLIKDLALFLSVNLNNVFRIKAVVAVGDYNKRILLQTVRKSYSMSDGTEWKVGEPIRSSFVFIGSDLDKEAVDAMIKKHVVAN
jgi:G3E family GTPase